MIDLFNAISYFLLFVATATAIMHHRFRDGVLMKIGLILMSVGFFAECVLAIQGFTQGNPQAVAAALAHTGIIVCVWSYLRRMRASSGKAKRVSDWIDQRRSVQ